MTRADIIEAWIAEAANILTDALPASLSGRVPGLLADLAPTVERAIAAHSGVPTADRVIVRDHHGTRLAAENPAMHDPTEG